MNDEVLLRGASLLPIAGNAIRGPMEGEGKDPLEDGTIGAGEEECMGASDDESEYDEDDEVMTLVSCDNKISALVEDEYRAASNEMMEDTFRLEFLGLLEQEKFQLVYPIIMMMMIHHKEVPGHGESQL